MADVANVTNGKPASEVPAESADAATADDQQAVEPPVEPVVAPTPPQQRSWTMPKSPVTRQQADEMGRAARNAVTGIAGFIAGIARSFAGAVQRLWRAIDKVPPSVKLLAVAGVLMLLGVVGAISLDNTLGLLCTVLVIPVCAAILGALGHRWYSRLDNEPAEKAAAPALEPATSDLQRSVEYVDKKLAVALTSFGTERHQQAVIALFQAKTAVELTLGTEQDPASYDGVPLPADGQDLRPRIRVGSASKSLLRESNSLAAS